MNDATMTRVGDVLARRRARVGDAIKGMGSKKSDYLRNQEDPTVLGYHLNRETLTPIRTTVNTSKKGDYGADPMGNGKFKMVPSGDIVDYKERCRRLGQTADKELNFGKPGRPFTPTKEELEEQMKFAERHQGGQKPKLGQAEMTRRSVAGREKDELEPIPGSAKDRIAKVMDRRRARLADASIKG